jgi:hypothetical protein
MYDTQINIISIVFKYLTNERYLRVIALIESDLTKHAKKYKS